MADQYALPANPNLVEFSKTDVAKRLKNNKRWTLSENKKPLDIYNLMTFGEFRGALETNSLYLTDMDTILNHPQLQASSHLTYYLDADLDDLVVLDIEPICPDGIKQEFLKMPCLYAERSMSGKGLHMVFEYPYDILQKHPDAMDKIVLKEKKDYEILIQHYVTFTGNNRGLNWTYGTDASAFRNVFEALASVQKKTESLGITIKTIDLSDIKADSLDRVLSLLGQSAFNWLRTHPSEQYGNDISRYEYAFLANTYKNLHNICQTTIVKKDHTYTKDEQARIMYDIATRYLPARRKHGETRNGGIPWLYFEVGRTIDTIDPTVKPDKKKKDEPTCEPNS